MAIGETLVAVSAQTADNVVCLMNTQNDSCSNGTWVTERRIYNFGNHAKSVSGEARPKNRMEDFGCIM